MFTLMLYLAATVMTAFSWDLWSFMFFSFLTGAGSAGNMRRSIPPSMNSFRRSRGHTDLAINGSWWLAARPAALLTIVLLNPKLIPEYLGWRLCFALGAVLGVSIPLVRRSCRESAMAHDSWRVAESGADRPGIEAQIMRDENNWVTSVGRRLDYHPRTGRMPFYRGSQNCLRPHPRPQPRWDCAHGDAPFMYNAISFTYPFVLTKFYAVPSHSIGLYIVPFAIGNFLGPVAGRFSIPSAASKMISLTYAVAGCLLASTGYLFFQGPLPLSRKLPRGRPFFLLRPGRVPI